MDIQPQHLEPCQVGWFVSPEGEPVRALCGKLTCITCAPRKLRKYRKRLEAIRWQRMLTLTTPAEVVNLQAGLAMQAASWRTVSRWLKRNAGMSDYTWCREVTFPSFDAHARPNLHMHVIFNSSYVPTGVSGRAWKRTLNAAIARAGFGQIFDIRKIRGNGANWYVTKYVSKCVASLPRYTRRLQSTVPPMRRDEPGWHWMGQGGFAGPQPEDFASMLRLFGSIPESWGASVADAGFVQATGSDVGRMGGPTSGGRQATSPNFRLNLIYQEKNCATDRPLPGDNGASDENQGRAGP